MKRVAVAGWLLFATLLIGIFSSFFVHRSFQIIDDLLCQAQQACTEQNYTACSEISAEANEQFTKREHLLAMFLRRDYLREISTDISGLTEYSRKEYAQDFLYESTKTRTKLAAIRHLFFSII